MRSLCLLIALVLSAAPCPAQSGECEDAYDFVVEAKEQIFAGKLSPADLKELHRLAKKRTEQCSDLAELWQVREQLAHMVNDEADVRVVRQRGSKFFVDKVYPKHGPFNPAAPIGKRWALLAGTNTFAHKNDLHLQDLEYAEADVKLIKKTLSSTLGFTEVSTLLGENFTLEGWRAAFARLREDVNEDDLVVIYLVSHGRPTKEDRNKTSFILTYGSEGPETPAIYTTSLQLIDLVMELSRELRAQRVVILLDSCFSGDAISGQRDSPGRPAPYLLEVFTRGSGRAIVAAARANQLSRELSTRKQGAFAWCFAKVATATATLGQIFSAVESCVSDEVKTLGPEQRQAPQIFASDGARAIVLGATK